MKTAAAIVFFAVALFGAMASAGCQHMDGAAESSSPGSVIVNFRAMEGFADFDDGPGGGMNADDYAAVLRRIMTEEARRHLAAGQTLTVTFTDIDLTGDTLPSMRMRMNRIRVIEEIYPARINLTFTLSGADGAAIKQGERTLSDRGFAMRTDLRSSGPLRYERELLRKWLQSELRGVAEVISPART